MPHSVTNQSDSFVSQIAVKQSKFFRNLLLFGGAMCALEGFFEKLEASIEKNEAKGAKDGRDISQHSSATLSTNCERKAG
ncbi:MAG: hypothetical protein MRY21_00470 [Simkaniaceae bacterium]|nr:hypothetical protein [Simkaniaceae bacterium]